MPCLNKEARRNLRMTKTKLEIAGEDQQRAKRLGYFNNLILEGLLKIDLRQGKIVRVFYSKRSHTSLHERCTIKSRLPGCNSAWESKIVTAFSLDGIPFSVSVFYHIDRNTADEIDFASEEYIRREFESRKRQQAARININNKLGQSKRKRTQQEITRRNRQEQRQRVY